MRPPNPCEPYGGDPMTQTLRLLLCRVQYVTVCAIVALSVALLASSAEAGQRRARLSRDLADRLSSQNATSADVIVSGTDEQVQVLATRYGARIKRRLQN